MNLVTLVMLLKSDLDVQQTGLRGVFVEHQRQTQVSQQNVTKITTITFVVLFPLHCSTQVQLRCSTNQPQRWVC